jgi:[acyl-carrier-protein] S-malonyltransferase
MLAPWLELPDTADLLATFSEAAGIDLAVHGTTSDADTIRDTAVAQPLIVASSLLAFRRIIGTRTAESTIDVTAGHSVGELTAAAVAGVLSDAGAVGLVRRRATAMAKAAAANPSGMSAVVGGTVADTNAAIEAAAAGTAGVWPANVNATENEGRAQIVAGGSLDGLAALAASAPRGTRVVPLEVAGAFHTPFMDSARDEFTSVAKAWPSTDPRLAFVRDLDGKNYASLHDAFGAAANPTGTFGKGTATDVIDSLAAQVTAPVRWDLVTATLASMNITGIIELAPGGVLTGLLRRAIKGVDIIAVKTPDDIEKARDIILTHSHAARVNDGSTLEGMAV